MSVVTAKVSSLGNDGSERVSNGAIVQQSQVNMSSNTNPAAAFYALFRFQLDVPQGATILSAFPRFYIANTGIDSPEGTIYFEASDNADALTTVSGNISGRARTSASQAWSANNLVSSSRYQTGPDLSPLVQEVVDRPGWQEGNYAALIWVPVTTVSKGMAAMAYSGNSAQAFELVVSYSTGSGVKIDRTIQAGPDDAHQFGGGVFASNSTWLNIYPISDTDTSSSFYRSAALRFTDIDVPQGATILSAYLEVRNRLGTGIACTIYGEASDNAPDFSDNPDILSRTLTTAFAEWLQDFMGVGYKPSPDISAIVQEIVDRPGWTPGGAMVFPLIALVSFIGDLGVVQEEIAAFENSLGTPAILHIEYEAEGGGETVTASAELQGSSSALASGNSAVSGSASFSAELSGASQSLLSLSSPASLSGSALSVALGTLELVSQALLSGSGAGYFSASLQSSSSLSLSAAGKILSSASISVLGASILQGSSSSPVVSLLVSQSSGSLQASGSLESANLVFVPGASAVQLSGLVEAAGENIGKVITGAAALLGAALLRAPAMIDVLALVELEGLSNVSSSPASLTVFGLPSLSGTGALKTDPVLIVQAVSDLLSSGVLKAQGNAIDMSVQTPDGRTFRVRLEIRTFQVGAEIRTFAVPLEIREVSADSIERTYSVPVEVRTVKVR